jgi:hypothetical protein
MINRHPVSNLYLEHYIYILQPFFFVQMGTNSNLVVFYKNVLDMDMLTWCKWKTFVLNFFDGSLQPQNKTKLNAQHRKHLETCLLQEIFVIV